MARGQKAVIMTGGSEGIGADVVKAFLGRDYNVVANSLNITHSGVFEPTDRLALIDGNIAEAAAAEEIADVATSRFGSIDALPSWRLGRYLPRRLAAALPISRHRW